MATANLSFNLPTVGGSEDTWGTSLNANWTALDGVLFGSSEIEPDLASGAWSIGGVTITATGAEVNYLDGVTSAIQTQIDAKQASDAGLTSIAGLTTAADQIIYLTGSDTYAVTTLTSYARTLLDDADASTARGTLGVGDGFVSENNSGAFASVDESGVYYSGTADVDNPGGSTNHVFFHGEINSNLAGQLAMDLSNNEVYVRARTSGTYGSWNALTASARTYTSAEQTITSGGSLTLAHGLGAAPKLLSYHLVCKTAEFNYSIGDELQIPPGNGPGTNQGMSVVIDGTNINIRYGLNGTVFSANNKTGGAGVSLTNANWRLVVTARL